MVTRSGLCSSMVSVVIKLTSSNITSKFNVNITSYKSTSEIKIIFLNCKKNNNPRKIKTWGFLTSNVDSLLTVRAITPKFMKAFMKVVVLTNIGSNKRSHKLVVITINIINVIHVIAIKVLRFIS